MLNIRRWNPWIGCLLVAASAGLVGCTAKTNVSATGNVPAQYSHLYMSVQEIWFHTSATAGPDDTAWIKFPLTTPVTVDLATSAGALTSLTSGLVVPAGTYAQVRLIPVDSGSPLLSSASTLGAVYNSEVDYTDATGAKQVPLELLNPDKGIGIATSILVKGTGTNIFSSSSNTSSSTTSTGTSSSSSTPFSLAINEDGAKDLVPFIYNNTVSTANTVNAMLLNPHMSAYDASAAGAITGTLSTAGLTGTTTASTSEFLNIQVTAESLSVDGTRHVAVNSTPVRSDGTFTLYPLATTSSSSTSYDLVIHGPSMATIIIKGVAVTVGAPSATTTVNVGTITPTAATSFTVNLTTTNLTTATVLPAGALVGFYQTLPGATEVPYLIEQEPIDPFSRKFDADQAISAGNLDYATFSGSAVSLSSATPAEGASTYRVAASAPLFADGVLTTTVSPNTTPVVVPTLSPASGLTNTTGVTISQTSPGSFDSGELIFSHDGAIVATAALDSIMGRSAATTLTITGLPSGSGAAGSLDSALYYVSVRVWNSTNPAGTLNRVTYPNALDLRTGITSAGYSIQIP
jgi:Domain of unknown function (DUF4382)